MSTVLIILREKKKICDQDLGAEGYVPVIWAISHMLRPHTQGQETYALKLLSPRRGITVTLLPQAINPFN